MPRNFNKPSSLDYQELPPALYGDHPPHLPRKKSRKKRQTYDKKNRGKR